MNQVIFVYNMRFIKKIEVLQEQQPLLLADRDYGLNILLIMSQLINTTSAISVSVPGISVLVPGIFQEVSFFTSQKQLLSGHLKILITLASDLVPGTQGEDV